MRWVPGCELQRLSLSLYFEKSTTWFFLIPFLNKHYTSVYCDKETGLGLTKRHIQIRRGASKYPSSSPVGSHQSFSFTGGTVPLWFLCDMWICESAMYWQRSNENDWAPIDLFSWKKQWSHTKLQVNLKKSLVNNSNISHSFCRWSSFITSGMYSSLLLLMSTPFLLGSNWLLLPGLGRSGPSHEQVPGSFGSRHRLFPCWAYLLHRNF